MLRVPRGRREHNVGAARAAGARVLRQRHVLPGRSNVHDRLPPFLQAGNPTVLPHKAALRFRHHFLAGFRALPRRRLESQRRLHLHNDHQ